MIHTSAPDPHFPFIHYGSSEKRGTVDFYRKCNNDFVNIVIVNSEVDKVKMGL